MKKDRNTREILKVVEKTATAAIFIINQILNLDIKHKSVNGSKKFVVTITLQKWEDIKLSNQSRNAIKEMYDSIKGKKQ